VVWVKAARSRTRPSRPLTPAAASTITSIMCSHLWEARHRIFHAAGRKLLRFTRCEKLVGIRLQKRQAGCSHFSASHDMPVECSIWWRPVERSRAHVTARPLVNSSCKSMFRPLANLTIADTCCTWCPSGRGHALVKRTSRVVSCTDMLFPCHALHLGVEGLHASAAHASAGWRRLQI
jgi:hypothetical protein